MKMVSALTVRKQFGSILDRVVKRKEVIAITRTNRPLVVIEPYESYKARTGGADRRARLTEVAKRIRKWAARNSGAMKEFDAVKSIRQMRDSR